MHPLLRIPTIVHLALCGGLAMCLGIFYFISMQAAGAAAAPGADNEINPDVFLPVAFLFALMGGAGSFILPGMLFSKIAQKPDSTAAYQPLGLDEIKKRIVQYQSLKIIQWALVEGSSIFCGLVFFLTGQLPLLLAAAGLLAVMIFHRPSREDFQKRMGLTDQQLSEAF